MLDKFVFIQPLVEKFIVHKALIANGHQQQHFIVFKLKIPVILQYIALVVIMDPDKVAFYFERKNSKPHNINVFYFILCPPQKVAKHKSIIR